MLYTLIVALCVLTSDMQFPDCSVGVSNLPPSSYEECETLRDDRVAFLTTEIAVKHPGAVSVLNSICSPNGVEDMNANIRTLGDSTVAEMVEKLKTSKGI